MILKISYDSDDQYHTNFSNGISKIQFDMILKISYDSKDCYVDILKISIIMIMVL